MANKYCEFGLADCDCLMPEREKGLCAWPRDWFDESNFGEELASAFPGQRAIELVKAIHNNHRPDGYDTSDMVFKKVKLMHTGSPDSEAWTWNVTFADDVQWNVVGWCDYLGWNCHSGLTWTRAKVGRR